MSSLLLSSNKDSLKQTLKISQASFIGQREYQEDRIKISSIGNKYILLTVCDGHAGHQCAEFTINNFPERVQYHLCDKKKNTNTTTTTATNTTKPLTALKRALNDIIQAWDDKCFKEFSSPNSNNKIKTRKPKNDIQRDAFFQSIDISSYEEKGLMSGSTILACLLQPTLRKFYLLSLGDSRAEWYIKKTNSLGSSLDHKPNVSYISESGSNFKTWIEDDEGTTRLNGQLAMSSAIGDNTPELYGSVGRRPHEYLQTYQDSCLVMILATDGLWDETRFQDIMYKKHCLDYVDQNANDNISVIQINHDIE